MKNLSIPLRYAKALWEASPNPEQGRLYLTQLRQIESLLSQEAGAIPLLNSSRIHREEKKQLLSRLFENRVEAEVLSLLLLLLDKGRMAYFPAVVDGFEELLNQEAGYLKASICTAQEIDPQQEEELRQALSALSGKKVLLEKETDAALIGGLSIRIGDKVYDGSIKSQLAELAKRMTKQR